MVKLKENEGMIQIPMRKDLMKELSQLAKSRGFTRAGFIRMLVDQELVAYREQQKKETND